MAFFVHSYNLYQPVLSLVTQLNLKVILLIFKGESNASQLSVQPHELDGQNSGGKIDRFVNHIKILISPALEILSKYKILIIGMSAVVGIVYMGKWLTVSRTNRKRIFVRCIWYRIGIAGILPVHPRAFNSPASNSTVYLSRYNTQDNMISALMTPCAAGFKRSAFWICKDDDECIWSPCNRTQQCVNLMGSYKCVCDTCPLNITDSVI